MPTTIEHIQEFLDESDLRYRVDPEHDAILIGFGIDPTTSTFRDQHGEPRIPLVIRVLERGEFVAMFCPAAWNVDGCRHKAAVFEAITAIQAQYKMLRFDYDPSDGGIRPNVEIPIEDAALTSQQIHDLLHGILLGTQRYDGMIRHAMNTGEVSFATVAAEPVGAPPPAIARLQRLAGNAGGIDELERLACGGDDDAADEGHPKPAAPAEPPAAVKPSAATDTVHEAGPSPPGKPAIRRIWEHLFGTDDSDPGTGRKAG